MIPLYTGKRDIYSFLEFYKNVEESKGLSHDEIQLIKDAYPNHELPSQYVAFLEVAGKVYNPWVGSDYSIVDEEGYFNLAKHIHDDEVLEKLYEKHGFTDKNCCVFLSHQTYAFYIFKLGESDNPEITYLEYNCDYDDESSERKEKPSKSYTFADYVIDSYNEEAYYANEEENPWQNASYSSWYERLRYVCSYPDKEIPLTFYADYDFYSIEKENTNGFIKLLAPILFECFDKNDYHIYVCSTGDAKDGVWYKPYLDEKFETPDFINLYKERSFFWNLRIEDSFGWIVNEGKVYIFGEKFRKLIEAKSDDFGIVKIESGKAAERPKPQGN